MGETWDRLKGKGKTLLLDVEPLNGASALFVAAYLLAVGGVGLYAVAGFFPGLLADPAGAAPTGSQIRLWGLAGTVPVGAETSLVLAVAAAAAVGAVVHGLGSLGLHVGKGDYHWRWTLWHLLNPAQGAILGVLLYLVLRGGLVVLDDTGLPGNPAVVLALCGLAGLSTKHTTEKLRQIFNKRLATPGEDATGPKPPTGDLTRVLQDKDIQVPPEAEEARRKAMEARRRAEEATRDAKAAEDELRGKLPGL